jgi:toxin YoeB
MGKYKIKIQPLAEKHLLLHRKSGNQATLKKIQKIFEELADNPYSGTGKPEELKYDLKGFWSRRINQKDRMIYSIDEYTVIVEVVSSIGHYLDK